MEVTLVNFTHGTRAVLSWCNGRPSESRHVTLRGDGVHPAMPEGETNIYEDWTVDGGVWNLIVVDNRTYDRSSVSIPCDGAAIVNAEVTGILIESSSSSSESTSGSI